MNMNTENTENTEPPACKCGYNQMLNEIIDVMKTAKRGDQALLALTVLATSLAQDKSVKLPYTDTDGGVDEILGQLSGILSKHKDGMTRMDMLTAVKFVHVWTCTILLKL